MRDLFVFLFLLYSQESNQGKRRTGDYSGDVNLQIKANWYILFLYSCLYSSFPCFHKLNTLFKRSATADDSYLNLDFSGYCKN